MMLYFGKMLTYFGACLLPQIEDALDAGHRAIGEKDATRLAQMAARERARKARRDACALG